MRLIVSLALLALIAPAATAQQPTAGTTTLTLQGVVVTANDVPLPRVRVALASAPLSLELVRLGASPVEEAGVLTDERGRFAIRVPVKTSVRLAFTKARYVSFTADVSPRDLTVPGSEIRAHMSLAGAISGRLFDRSGAQLMLANVVLRRADDPPSAPPISTTTTNDLGEYRFGGLAAGRYVVKAQSSALALGADNPDRQKMVEAAAVESPAVSVDDAEISNLNLTLDAPSEMDRDRAIGADPEATGSVSGRVIGVDGLPVVRAVVHAYRPYVAGRQVETDLRGQYRIDRLGPGDYNVEARKYGFDTTRRQVTLTNGQAAESINMTLTRGGAIAGTVVDEFGEPMRDVVVGVLQLQSAGGRTRAVRASAQGSRTDDRGQYRLFGIKPGAYVVQAVVRDTLAAAGRGYLPRFYPGIPTLEQATTVKVDFGATITGVDFTLVPTPSNRVTGSVFDASGKPGRGEVVLGVSERSGAVQTDLVGTQIRVDGSFEFTNVAPGDYVVQAGGMTVAGQVPGGTRMQTQFATSFVTVSAADPPPVQLRMTEGATLSGRVRYEGIPPGPTPLLTLVARSADGDRSPLRAYGSTSFSPLPDNSFEHTGAFGHTLFVAQPQQSDWYLKSVVFKGQDITDTPFDFGTGGSFRDIEVVISARGGTATGRVTDGRGAPVADCSVLVFSTSRDKWFDGSRWLKVERPAEDGAFTATGLPPGEYWVAAIERPDRTVERGIVSPDRDLLDSLSSRAVRITLGEGESQDLTLRLLRR